MRPPALLAAIALALPLATAHQAGLYESFEEGLGAWSRDADVDCWRGEDPCAWRWSIDRVPGAASDGAWGLLFAADGIHDDGSFWMERAIVAPPGERVDLAFWVLMPRVSPYAHWQVKGYLGVEDPEAQADLVTLGDTDVIPGWNRFCLSAPAAEAGSPMWAAFGLRVSFEEPRVFALDHASLRGASGGEPCSLLEDPCHVAGSACRAREATCAVAACTMRDG